MSRDWKFSFTSGTSYGTSLPALSSAMSRKRGSSPRDSATASSSLRKSFTLHLRMPTDSCWICLKLCMGPRYSTSSSKASSNRGSHAPFLPYSLTVDLSSGQSYSGCARSSSHSAFGFPSGVSTFSCMSGSMSSSPSTACPSTMSDTLSPSSSPCSSPSSSSSSSGASASSSPPAGFSSSSAPAPAGAGASPLSVSAAAESFETGRFESVETGRLDPGPASPSSPLSVMAASFLSSLSFFLSSVFFFLSPPPSPSPSLSPPPLALSLGVKKDSTRSMNFMLSGASMYCWNARTTASSFFRNSMFSWLISFADHWPSFFSSLIMAANFFFISFSFAFFFAASSFSSTSPSAISPSLSSSLSAG
mmetsp:Transcript_10644/g.25324  ORF Transcript_10644/g.25324 Transcript_10644/m.25324 type:complete len:362 (-) Transcript_10644:3020-4105(-)